MLERRWRDALSLLIAGLVILASATVWFAQTPDLGFSIAPRDGEYVIGSVTPGGWMDQMGIGPGVRIESIDGRAFAEVFEEVAAEASEDGGLEPLRRLMSWSNRLVLDGPIGQIAVERVLWIGSDLYWSLLPFALGLLVLAAGMWWLMGGRAGAGLRDLAIPMTVASATPLLSVPLAAWGAPVGTLAAMIAPPLASLLFADALIALIVTRRVGMVTLLVASVAAVVAVGLPLMSRFGGLHWYDFEAGAWWAMLLITLVPMLVVTARSPRPGSPLAGAGNPGPLWLLAAAATPAIAMLDVIADGSRDWGARFTIVVWLVGLVVARAIGRRIAHARLQRDLIVTVTEAERARLAAELHDVALQELTLLVRRLDASGDAASASMAREVSERLRDLCGELRLPILDELGAGPALEWLVEQVALATGQEIRLERSDIDRPPPDVELAVFRVAQEAVSNAVKHGGPPILVRYVTSSSAATLSVDDGGPGPDIGQGSVAPRPGHYGLTTMQQRAEQIGALFSIRAWPDGGTRVSLEWRTA